ncbi:MAG TPA: hypothetical protein VL335_00445 [Candidatus Paceibacterota bacterium]|nr:hypothetical protein [Candidatus Paceibacterota bacterium]
MTEWVVRVEKAMQAFEQFRCQGVIEAMVVSNMIGYGTEGTLFVFDDQTNDAMSSVVAELFRVLNDKPRQTELYMACFIITLKMETVYIQDEGVDVPFEELDTEPYQRPKATKVVTLPSPILN